MSGRAEIASEWRYRNPGASTRTRSSSGSRQSGETADTLRALSLARERGARTVAITNSIGSQITREVDAVLFTHTGLEMGVAATKTFPRQVGARCTCSRSRSRGACETSAAGRDALMTRSPGMPHKMRRVPAMAPSRCDAVRASTSTAKPFFLFLGRHVGLPVALEGALKLKEIRYIPTEAIRRAR